MLLTLIGIPNTCPLTLTSLSFSSVTVSEIINTLILATTQLTRVKSLLSLNHWQSNFACLHLQIVCSIYR